jgi:hypothetical protein
MRAELFQLFENFELIIQAVSKEISIIKVFHYKPEVALGVPGS